MRPKNIIEVDGITYYRAGFLRLTAAQEAKISGKRLTKDGEGLPKGWHTTRSVAARLGLTEGGLNGTLVRLKLQTRGDSGAYSISPLAESLKLGQMHNGERAWRDTKLVAYIKANPYNRK